MSKSYFGKRDFIDVEKDVEHRDSPRVNLVEKDVEHIFGADLSRVNPVKSKVEVVFG